MISTSLARRLRDAGLRWKPASGDRFQIDRPELDADVFTAAAETSQSTVIDSTSSTAPTRRWLRR